jgi:hypothetical protein
MQSAAQGRAVRQTTKAAWVRAICVFIAFTLTLLSWIFQEVDPDAGQGMAIFAGIAVVWAIFQEWSIRRQIVLMRFGEVATATITGAWTIPGRHRIYVRRYQFSTETGRTVEKFTTVNDIDALVTPVGAEVEVVYDARRPRRATFSRNIWAADLVVE